MSNIQRELKRESIDFFCPRRENSEVYLREEK